MISLISRPCTLVQRGTTTYDQYGDPTGTPVTTSTFCEIQPVNRPGSQTEVEEGNIGIGLYKVYLDGAVQPDNTDAVIIDSNTYEFHGDPIPRRNPRTGAFMFTEAWMRLVE